MLLGLLIYGYASERFSSKEIERATQSDAISHVLKRDGLLEYSLCVCVLVRGEVIYARHDR